MYDEDWVSLSEIEHWSYCPRQWAIIHLEQCFIDNDDTTRGHLEHQRVDQPGHENRRGHRSYTAVDVASETEMLHGRCDRIDIEGNNIVPIEFKSGVRHHPAAELQLVGQAICLEDMLSRPVTNGKIYLAASNRTVDIDVGNPVRRGQVRRVAQAIRRARSEGARLPPPANDQRCPPCSLKEVCLPGLIGNQRRQSLLFGATWCP